MVGRGGGRCTELGERGGGIGGQVFRMGGGGVERGSEWGSSGWGLGRK
jgi:hypothetical protein